MWFSKILVTSYELEKNSGLRDTFHKLKTKIMDLYIFMLKSWVVVSYGLLTDHVLITFHELQVYWVNELIFFWIFFFFLNIFCEKKFFLFFEEFLSCLISIWFIFDDVYIYFITCTSSFYLLTIFTKKSIMPQENQTQEWK